MMSRFSLLRIGGCAALLLIGGQATAQEPHSQSQTSAVQRFGTDSAAASDSAPAPTGVTRELVCRGKPGIDLRVHRESVPERPGHVTMVLRYERLKEVHSIVQRGMGGYESRSFQFIPGSCTWGGGWPGIPFEPLVVYFDLPRDAQTHLAPAQRDTTARAAVSYPDVASVRRYLSDSSRYWIFYVDDASNVSISFRSRELMAPGPTGHISGSLRDAAPGGATLTSVRVVPADSAARTVTVVPTPAPAPAPTASGTVGGPLRDKSPGAATVAGARPLPTDSAARRTATARTPTPAPTGGVDGPLRDDAPATGSVSSGRALPTDSAARRTATVRTPTPGPTGSMAGPLRDKLPAAAPSTSRVMPTDTAAKVPDDARAKAPQLRVNRVYDVRTAPGPFGVRLTFNATGAGATGGFRELEVYNPTGGIGVQFSRRPPSWDSRERRWSYAAGVESPWYAEVELGAKGGFEAEPLTRLTNGERYYYLITVHGSDPSAPPGQRTGSFTADVRESTR
jgi:hypothetical protein